MDFYKVFNWNYIKSIKNPINNNLGSFWNLFNFSIILEIRSVVIFSLECWQNKSLLFRLIDLGRLIIAACSS